MAELSFEQLAVIYLIDWLDVEKQEAKRLVQAVLPLHGDKPLMPAVMNACRTKWLEDGKPGQRP